jgi:hypothetical protein
MAEIHQDPKFVHPLDGFDTGLAQARVSRFEAAIAEQIATVVGRLNDSDAQAIKLIQAREVGFKGDAVLESVQEPDTPGSFGVQDVGSPSDPAEHVGMPVNLALGIGDAGVSG